MANKKIPEVKKKKTPVNKKKVLVISICAFLAAIIVFGAALGIISLVNRANSVFSYDGITMDEQMASFFIGRFKTTYINAISKDYPEAENTEKFWNSPFDEERTHGDVMRELCINRLKQIMVESYLFDEYATLSDEDEAIIEKAISDTVKYHASDSRDKFDSISENYGFDYESYCKAVEMLYKADNAFEKIYGADGSRLASQPKECDEYLNEYSHVSLIFIRTEDRLIMNDGEPSVVVELTEEERAARLESIETIRAAISAKENGGDGFMTPQAFASFLAQYGEGDKDFDLTGYYFHKDSEYTAEYAVQFSAITEKALSMKIGEYAEVAVDVRNMLDPNAGPSPAVCFIYKTNAVSGAYGESSLSRCFSDFYKNASNALHLKVSEELHKLVEVGPKLSELDFSAIATNSELYPRYEKK